MASAGIAALVGCASGEMPEPTTTFGDPTYPMMTVGMTSPADDGMDSGDDGGTSDTEGTEAGADDGDASGGTDNASDTAADDTPSNTEQPDNGMYSDCLSTAECVGVNTCVTIFDMAGDPFDGFCTLDNCSDPAMDCDPSPGGDVTPTCVEITLNGSPASACALGCSGGLTCPDGMVCYEDDGIPVCA